MNLRAAYLAVVLLFTCHFLAKTQVDTLFLDLKGTIILAQSDAPDVLIAKTAFKNGFWRYQSFLADYRPQIVLEATLPNINRAIDAIDLPDGQVKFLERSFMNNSVGVSLQQGITATGGRIFAGTGLERIDIFPNAVVDKQISYLSNPLFFGLVQPLFGFNQLKWDKKIRPMVFQEASKAYSEDMEQVAYQSANLFFDVLFAQLNLEAAKRDKTNADTLYAISKGRFDVGRIAETELLQIELSVMNANADLAESQLNLQTSTEELRNFLGIQQAVAFKLDPPYQIPIFQIDGETALQYARQNRSNIIALERRLEQAKMDIAQAKANNRPSVNLSLSFGLSQTSRELSEAYKELLDQERVTLGLQMPIADWGKSQARLQIATSNAELTNLEVTQERVNFEREVIVKVQQFDLVRNQVNLALRAYEVAQKRLNLTRQRYRIGKIQVTDFNIAIQEEASGRRSYIAALRNFWLAYYDLRQLTLYDFENGLPLVRNANDLSGN
ncbi:MAG: TolC family protein [Saprospiraceae bacterium]